MKMIEVIKENKNNSFNGIKNRKIKMEKKNQYLKESQEKRIVEIKE